MHDEHERFLIRYSHHFAPFTVARASGAWIETTDGRRILDFTSGQICSTIGHNHPQIVAAVQRTLDEVIHLNSWMLSEPVLALDVSELRTSGVSKCNLGPPRRLSFCVLGRQNHGVEGIQALTERIASLRQGNLLFHGGTEPKELAHFIERTAKTCGRCHASKPTHRVVTLFDATAVLLQSVIEITIAAVGEVTAKGLANRRR